MRRPAAALAGAAALVAMAGAAEARPYKELCEQFEPLRKLSDLKYVKPVLRVQPKEASVKPRDVVFTLETKSGPVRIVPADDGVIEFPMTDKLCEENPNLEVNQPKGTVNLSVLIDPAMPPVRALDYRQLDALRREWETAIARQSLVYRLLAPGARAFQVVFEPGAKASVEIRLPQGTRQLAADEKGIVRIPFEEAWIAANPAIVFSEVPKKIGLGFKA